MSLEPKYNHPSFLFKKIESAFQNVNEHKHYQKEVFNHSSKAEILSILNDPFLNDEQKIINCLIKLKIIDDSLFLKNERILIPPAHLNKNVAQVMEMPLKGSFSYQNQHYSLAIPLCRFIQYNLEAINYFYLGENGVNPIQSILITGSYVYEFLGKEWLIEALCSAIEDCDLKETIIKLFQNLNLSTPKDIDIYIDATKAVEKESSMDLADIGKEAFMFFHLEALSFEVHYKNGGKKSCENIFSLLNENPIFIHSVKVNNHAIPWLFNRSLRDINTFFEKTSALKCFRLHTFHFKRELLLLACYHIFQLGDHTMAAYHKLSELVREKKNEDVFTFLVSHQMPKKDKIFIPSKITQKPNDVEANKFQRFVFLSNTEYSIDVNFMLRQLGNTSFIHSQNLKINLSPYFGLQTQNVIMGDTSAILQFATRRMFLCNTKMSDKKHLPLIWDFLGKGYEPINFDKFELYSKSIIKEKGKSKLYTLLELINDWQKRKSLKDGHIVFVCCFNALIHLSYLEKVFTLKEANEAWQLFINKIKNENPSLCEDNFFNIVLGIEFDKLLNFLEVFCFDHLFLSKDKFQLSTFAGKLVFKLKYYNRFLIIPWQVTKSYKAIYNTIDTHEKFADKFFTQFPVNYLCEEVPNAYCASEAATLAEIAADFLKHIQPVKVKIGYSLMLKSYSLQQTPQCKFALLEYFPLIAALETSTNIANIKSQLSIYFGISFDNLNKSNFRFNIYKRLMFNNFSLAIEFLNHNLNYFIKEELIESQIKDILSNLLKKDHVSQNCIIPKISLLLLNLAKSNPEKWKIYIYDCVNQFLIQKNYFCAQLLANPCDSFEDEIKKSIDSLVKNQIQSDFLFLKTIYACSGADSKKREIILTLLIDFFKCHVDVEQRKKAENECVEWLKILSLEHGNHLLKNIACCMPSSLSMTFLWLTFSNFLVAKQPYEALKVWKTGVKEKYLNDQYLKLLIKEQNTIASAYLAEFIQGLSCIKNSETHALTSKLLELGQFSKKAISHATPAEKSAKRAALINELLKISKPSEVVKKVIGIIHEVSDPSQSEDANDDIKIFLKNWLAQLPDSTNGHLLLSPLLTNPFFLDFFRDVDFLLHICERILINESFTIQTDPNFLNAVLNLKNFSLLYSEKKFPLFESIYLKILALIEKNINNKIIKIDSLLESAIDYILNSNCENILLWESVIKIVLSVAINEIDLVKKLWNFLDLNKSKFDDKLSFDYILLTLVLYFEKNEKKYTDALVKDVEVLSEEHFEKFIVFLTNKFNKQHIAIENFLIEKLIEKPNTLRIKLIDYYIQLLRNKPKFAVSLLKLVLTEEKNIKITNQLYTLIDKTIYHEDPETFENYVSTIEKLTKKETDKLHLIQSLIAINDKRFVNKASLIALKLLKEYAKNKNARNQIAEKGKEVFSALMKHRLFDKAIDFLPLFQCELIQTFFGHEFVNEINRYFLGKLPTLFIKYLLNQESHLLERMTQLIAEIRDHFNDDSINEPNSPNGHKELSEFLFQEVNQLKNNLNLFNFSNAIKIYLFSFLTYLEKNKTLKKKFDISALKNKMNLVSKCEIEINLERNFTMHKAIVEGFFHLEINEPAQDELTLYQLMFTNIWFRLCFTNLMDKGDKSENCALVNDFIFFPFPYSKQLCDMHEKISGSLYSVALKKSIFTNNQNLKTKLQFHIHGTFSEINEKGNNRKILIQQRKEIALKHINHLIDSRRYNYFEKAFFCLEKVCSDATLSMADLLNLYLEFSDNFFIHAVSNQNSYCLFFKFSYHIKNFLRLTLNLNSDYMILWKQTIALHQLYLANAKEENLENIFVSALLFTFIPLKQDPPDILLFQFYFKNICEILINHKNSTAYQIFMKIINKDAKILSDQHPELFSWLWTQIIQWHHYFLRLSSQDQIQERFDNAINFLAIPFFKNLDIDQFDFIKYFDPFENFAGSWFDSHAKDIFTYGYSDFYLDNWIVKFNLFMRGAGRVSTTQWSFRVNYLATCTLELINSFLNSTLFYIQSGKVFEVSKNKTLSLTFKLLQDLFCYKGFNFKNSSLESFFILTADIISQLEQNASDYSLEYIKITNLYLRQNRNNNFESEIWRKAHKLYAKFYLKEDNKAQQLKEISELLSLENEYK